MSETEQLIKLSLVIQTTLIDEGCPVELRRSYGKDDHGRLVQNAIKY